MERLNRSRQTLHNSINRLLSIRSISPGAYRVLSPRLFELSRVQSKLEVEASRNRGGNAQLGFPFVIPLLWAGAVTLTGFFGWRVSKQLTEATDYDKRLEKFLEAKGQGLSDTDALRVIGVTGGFGIGTAIVIGSVAIAAIFLFRR